MLIVKNIESNSMCNMQELHLFLCILLLAIFNSSIFSVHASTNLSTSLFLHLQLL